MISFPVVVQFIRNLFCVVKTVLRDKSLKAAVLLPLAKDLNVGHITIPLKSITILEWVVLITQMLAMYFNIRSGIKSLVAGSRQKINLSSWKKAMVSRFSGDKNKFDLLGFFRTPTQKVLEDGIAHSDAVCNRTIISGICDLAIGVAFAVLALNSSHYFSEILKDIKPVIDSLIAMEIALLFYLYIMISDLFYSRHYYYGLLEILKRQKDFNENPVQLMETVNLSGSFCKVLSYTPAWDHGKSSLTLESEIITVRALLAGFTTISFLIKFPYALMLFNSSRRC